MRECGKTIKPKELDDHEREVLTNKGQQIAKKVIFDLSSSGVKTISMEELKKVAEEKKKIKVIIFCFFL